MGDRDQGIAGIQLAFESMPERLNAVVGIQVFAHCQLAAEDIGGDRLSQQQAVSACNQVWVVAQGLRTNHIVLLSRGKFNGMVANG